MMRRKMAASSVDLPDPMTPVTSTRPFDGMAWSRMPCSTFKSSSAGGMEGMARNTILTPVEYPSATGVALPR